MLCAIFLGQRVLRASLVAALVFPAATGHSQKSQGALTRVEQIRHLSREEAKLHLPVHLRGTILSDVPSPSFVLHDQTGGVFVFGNPKFAAVHRLGDVVDVEGFTDEGFAPILRETSTKVLGKGAVPTAKLYPVSALQSGQFDSQWVKTRGVVQSATIDDKSWSEPSLNLNIVSGDGRFEVLVPLRGEQLDPKSYVNREVMIEGICGSLSNAAHQFLGIIFYVPRLKFIRSLDAIRLTPLASLLQFAPDKESGERTAVTGVVSYQLPGDMIFLQDADSGLRVKTEQAPTVRSGDIVQVTGFAATGESKPILQDGLVRIVGHGLPPEPKKLTVTPPFERFDGVLVRSEGKLLQKTELGDSLSLQLESGGFSFSAVVRGPDRTKLAEELPINATLSVVGVCLVRNGGVWHTPSSFTILVPSAADVTISARPPWWNARHAVWLALPIPFVFAFICVWVMLLRGKLHRQVALYRRKLHSGAILEERSRIARELHDSLEQDLAGIVLQLDLAADCFDSSSHVSRKALDAARSMSRRGMVEARRSVWDMRCDLLEQGDLPYALKLMVEMLNQREQGRVTLICAPISAQIPKSAELNLLRIAQEATTNSLKHAKATRIELSLRQEAYQLQLQIQDNGAGFNPKTGYFDGHFGLVDMQERASAVGSELTIKSAAGLGTTVSVVFPLSRQSVQHG